RRVFPNGRAFADLDDRRLALVLEVLGIAAEHGADAGLHVRAKRHIALERRACAKHAAVADNAAVADDRECPDLHARAQLGARMNERRGMDGCRHLSRTIAPISASATTSPSTFAMPDILHIIPRICRSSSSNRSWSPGFTGRRHFTLLSEVKYTTLDSGSGTAPINSIPPTCAMASMISTPGMIGCPGKWPWKNGSLIVTFFRPTMRLPGSISSTRSTSRNG